MNDLDVIASALVVLAVADWFWTGLLVYAAHKLPEPALADRAAAAVISSFAASLFAVMGAVWIADFRLSSVAFLTILVIAGVAISLPQFIWGFGLLTGRFR